MMNGVLKEIVELKRREAPKLRPGMKSREKGILGASTRLRSRPFIAEIKKASPSAGDITPAADPRVQAERYDRGGAGAISVLTESSRFRGSIADMEAVARCSDLPVLCKDFIVHENQIIIAHESGADAVLLIAAILTEPELRRLTSAAHYLGMEVLHEIHGMEEFGRIARLDLSMVGVNARDLSDFTVDLAAAAVTMRALDGGFLKIAESGIASADDVRFMRSAGAEAFLVGTSLMKAEDPEAALRGLYAGLEGPCS